MKISRLLTYAAIGIISGLLVENRAMLTREHVKDAARKLKGKMDKKMKKVHEAIEA